MSNRYSSSSEQSITPKKSKFSEIAEAENESDDLEDEGDNRDNRYYSSDDSEEDLEIEILRKRQRFQEELKEIKKIMLSSSEEKTKQKPKSNSKNFVDISSQLYESAKSNTLDLSDTQQNIENFSLGANLVKSQPMNDIEQRIKKLEEELSSNFKNSSSKQSIKSSAAKSYTNEVNKKIIFLDDNEQKKMTNFDLEAKELNYQIEQIKDQLENELKKEKENRQKIKRQMEISAKKKQKPIPEKEKPNQKKKSQERLPEQEKKQQKSQSGDLSSSKMAYSDMGILQPIGNTKRLIPAIPESNSTVQLDQKTSSEFIKIENQNSVSTMSKKDKLDYEIEILYSIFSTIFYRKRLENIRRRLKRSISRKVSEQTIQDNYNRKTNLSKQTISSNKSLNINSYQQLIKDKAQNNSKHCSNCTYLLNKGVPTSFCSHQ